METTSSAAPVRDVTAENFEELVLRRSSEAPVLVDFWAPWCGPCRILGPVLEKLAAEMGGAFELAKVNSDEHPELSMEYGVRGIPACKLFKDGEIVDEFVGALPEREVRAFLRRWCPSDADRLAAEGRERSEAGATGEARQRWETALALDSRQPAALLGLARLDLAEGDLEAAAARLDEIPADAEEQEEARAVGETLELARAAAEIGDRASCEARLADDPSDVEARWALGGHAAADGDLREALEHFLEAVEIDRTWRGEAPRKAMVTVFGLVGARHPLAEEFRDRLRRLLY